MALIPSMLATMILLLWLRLSASPGGDRGGNECGASSPTPPHDHAHVDEDEDVVRVPPEGSALPAPAGVSRPPSFARNVGTALPVLATLATLLTLPVLVVALMGGEEIAGIPVAGNTPFALVLISISFWAIYLLWKVPQWQAAAWAAGREVEADKVFEIENASRGTLGQILSGVAVLTGLFFAWQQLGSTSETLRVSQEGQITDRFSRAVEQLGSDNLTVRLGGVYALERIARDSERDYGPAIEVLTSFARRQSNPSTAAGGGTPAAVRSGISADVEAVLKVIARREPWQRALHDPAEDGYLGCVDLSRIAFVGADLRRIDLRGVCLRDADLQGALLDGANLSGADLLGATLIQSRLTGANLAGAQLTEANLSSALLLRTDLSGANLTGADLSGAALDETNLAGANLNGARLAGAFLSATRFGAANLLGVDFTGAILSGADLAAARGLEPGQLANVGFIDDATALPPGYAATPEG